MPEWFLVHIVDPHPLLSNLSRHIDVLRGTARINVEVDEARFQGAFVRLLGICFRLSLRNWTSLPERSSRTN